MPGCYFRQVFNYTCNIFTNNKMLISTNPIILLYILSFNIQSEELKNFSIEFQFRYITTFLKRVFCFHLTEKRMILV